MADAAAGRALRVLHLEDSPLDAELTAELLLSGGRACEIDVAGDKRSFERLLAGGGYDVVLADFSLPDLDAVAALDLTRAALGDVPFICISGTIGEEMTVELLRRGADDCVVKDRMARLPHAVDRAIEERASRRRLAQSERHAAALLDNLLNGYAWCRLLRDEHGRAADWLYLDVNPAFERLTGLTDVVGRKGSELVRGFDRIAPGLLPAYERVARTGVPETLEVELRPAGTWQYISIYSTEPDTYIVVFEDVSERHEAVAALLDGAHRLRRTLEGAVEAMGAMIAARDPYTAGHERRVTQLAVTIATAVGLPPSAVEGVRLAGLVHDVGKLVVPAEILTKPSRLSAMEFELIKSHPGAGHEMLAAIEFEQPVADIVLQHHERLDGLGYPQGLRGEEILPEARVLAVADVVEAMASHRPYRPALGIDAALAEVRGGADRVYDADAVAACDAACGDGFTFDDV
jgi:putative nucleotidyltransferase with HDIG domain